jgi:hypothetical protein
MMGSAGVETPLRYDINYRNYFLVTQGSIKVKMMPPKSGKYLYPLNDYENLEFRSPVNPWNTQTKFRADFDKVKCLEIVLTPGKFLFIPAYWWYSFKFAENTSVSCFNYRTYMNNIAISPHIFMYALQNQNVERKIAKKIDIKVLNKDGLITESVSESTTELIDNNLDITNETNENLVSESDDTNKMMENKMMENNVTANNVTSIDNSFVPEFANEETKTNTSYSSL